MYKTKFIVLILILHAMFASHALSQVVRRMTGSTVLEIDKISKDTVVYTRTNKYADGSLMTVSKCDGVIFIQFGNFYFKRKMNGPVKTKWFHAKADINTPLNSAISIANDLKVAVEVSDNITSEYIRVWPRFGFTGPGIVKYQNAYIYKPGLVAVGIPQNLAEKKYVYPKLFEEGNIIEPPVASTTRKRPVSILAHWYNDFGLQRTALSKNQANGSYVWYDWSWNFSHLKNYDPARHPLLGWYRGDEAVNLDWICYWLVKYGINGVILSNTFSTENWSSPQSKSYWLHELFTKTKNFKKINYSVWLAANHGTTIAHAERTDRDMINNILKNYKNVNCFEEAGRRYPIFYAWDMEGFRGTYDKYNGSKNSVKRLKVLAQMCRSIGYDGICIFGRNLSTAGGAFNNAVLDDLKNAGVYLFSQDYSTTYTKESSLKYTSYSSYAADVKFPADPLTVLTVITSGYTQKPHPSNWKLDGSSPSLFKKVLQKGVDVTLRSNKPKFVVVYNVSEWAEAGPGLIPNQKDLFGYLEAVSGVGMN